MTWLQRTCTLLALGLALVTLVPGAPASACSCAQPTADELLGYEPDAAIARITRIDIDGGSTGIGRVDEVLHGPDLPAQLPLDLDSGSSCLPWVSVGDTAVLAFVPDGDAWRTVECGLLDATVGVPLVVADPDAAGPPAVAVVGRFPGADVLTLDDQLRVLAAGTLDGVAYGQIRACSGSLLVTTGRDDGTTALVLIDVTLLEATAEHTLGDDPEQYIEVLDTTCTGDRVDVVTATWSDGRQLRLHADVFGDPRLLDLPPADDATVVDGEVLLLTTTQEGGERAVVSRFDPASGESSDLAGFGGITGYELDGAPDGAHAIVRGFADAPVLVTIDLSNGREVGRSSGWWQPVAVPWIDAERILQLDEDAGGIGDTGLAHYRIVDLELSPLVTLEPTPAWNAVAANGAVLLADGRGLAVLDGDGRVVRAVADAWSAGVHDGVVLGPVDDGPDQREATPTAANPGTNTGTDDDAGGSSSPGRAPSPGVAIAVASIGAAVLLGLGALQRSRVRRGVGSGSAGRQVTDAR